MQEEDTAYSVDKLVKNESDAAGGVGEVEPDFYAAEVGAFGADGCGDAGADVAWGADVARELRVDFAELCDFVHGGAVDFFLGVEAGAHGPFVEKMEKGTGLDQPDRLRVGKNVKRDFRGDAAIEEFVFGVPRVMHGAFINFPGARIALEQHGRDVVGLAGVGECQ